MVQQVNGSTCYCATCRKDTPHVPRQGQIAMDGEPVYYLADNCMRCGNKSNIRFPEPENKTDKQP